MASREVAPTFKVKVNLVVVRVVVRNAQGRAVGNLRKEDFQLLDNRKPQVISKFSVEQPGSEIATAAKTSENAGVEAASQPPPALPEHYIAYLFDDIHLHADDLIRARDAAVHNLATLLPTDRAAVFSTSGQTVVDFTDDRAKLHDGLMRLQPHPIGGSGLNDCPQMTYYMADQIENKHDPRATQIATQDALDCAFDDDTKFLAAAQALAAQAVQRELSFGEHESQVALGTIKSVLLRIAAVPGQRTVVLVSPGFLNPDDILPTVGDIIDQATRSNIIISALDARGLYAIPPGGDISERNPNSALLLGAKTEFQTASAFAEGDVMADLADGTGGTFFHNSNDLDGGMKRVASAPEYYYVLGFAPQNLKTDGRFHKLKVEVKSTEKLSVQARNGYYAPKHIANPAEQAKSEIEDALFSQEETNDLPVELHTQFFKPTDTTAKLTVLARIDVKRVRFQKAGGRNNNTLTVVSGLFDRNGNYVAAQERILEMHLKDDTLANKVNSGVTMKSSFDVKPGSYLVRLVVRDEEGLITAQNGAVEIP